MLADRGFRCRDQSRRRRTPGVANPDITLDNIADNVCNMPWSTRMIRSPSSYTSEAPAEDPENLWPEPYNTTIDGETVGRGKSTRSRRNEARSATWGFRRDRPQIMAFILSHSAPAFICRDSNHIAFSDAANPASAGYK